MMSSDGFMSLQDRVFPSTQELIVEHPSMSKSSISGGDSEPRVPPDSPGSSVSSRLQEEYDELMKYAIVLPSYPSLPSLALGRTLASTDNTVKSPAGTSFAPDDQLQKLPVPVSNTVVETQSIQPTSSSQYIPPSAVGAASVVDVKQKSEIGQRPSMSTLHYQQTSVADVDVSSSQTSETGTLDGSVSNIEPSKRPAVDVTAASGNLRHPTGTAVPYVASQQPFKQSYLPTNEEESANDSELQDESNDAVYTASVDNDMARMDNLLDQWTTDLKRNIMGEFGQAKIRLIEHHRQQMLREKQRHAGEVMHLQNDIESLRELLATYEQSIQRKDQVISNLTAGLQHHRNRMEVQRNFCEWKSRHNDAKREAFASNLASKHYQRKLELKVWTAWHSLIEAKWRQRVEKACQAKAQEVCIALTNDYETKLASVNEALEAARHEVGRLHEERERYEENMKKAFMRGVCALNMEAMSLFHETSDNKDKQRADDDDDDNGNDTDGVGEGQYRRVVNGGEESCGDRTSRPVTVQQEYVYHTDASAVPPARVVTAQVPVSAMTSHVVEVTRVRPPGRGAKVIRTKITARQDSKQAPTIQIAGQTLAPPMPTVVVERHQPITKQTIGHATAARYAQQTSSTPTMTPPPVQIPVVQRKIAGQSNSVIPITNLQTVKVVE